MDNRYDVTKRHHTPITPYFQMVYDEDDVIKHHMTSYFRSEENGDKIVPTCLSKQQWLKKGETDEFFNYILKKS